jgi:hypothetical protein
VEKSIENELTVRVRGGLGGTITLGKVTVVTWSRQERLRRAAKALGISLGVGLFCVILPLVHFVLVPAALIAGFVLFSHLWKQRTLILGGSAECPECKASFRISRGRDHFPMSEVCDSCRANLTIERVKL